jgi:hypothetical protein
MFFSPKNRVYILYLWVWGFLKVLLRAVLALMREYPIFILLRVKTNTVKKVLTFHLYHRSSLESLYLILGFLNVLEMA